ncbi:hypothetical protein BN970_03157 [Mycolicibacterium conceptionense]|uniref:Uncharacterized protein n=1 Tax=Mycolicibacterium conceptionense TaxID=451644 RepID=A0A0U1DF93_9MYCO|nr:hypothetical protein BN970_03157 [Mycolicibacterium conceptionense]
MKKLYIQPTETPARAATDVVVTPLGPALTSKSLVAVRTLSTLSWLRAWIALRDAPACRAMGCIRSRSLVGASGYARSVGPLSVFGWRTAAAMVSPDAPLHVRFRLTLFYAEGELYRLAVWPAVRTDRRARTFVTGPPVKQSLVGAQPLTAIAAISIRCSGCASSDTPTRVCVGARSPKASTSSGATPKNSSELVTYTVSATRFE